MKKRNLLFKLFLCSQMNVAQGVAPLIIGGERVQDTLIRQATVSIDNDCTGAYIGDNIVLTAGHCVSGENVSPKIVSFWTPMKSFDCRIIKKVYDSKDTRHGKRDLALVKVGCDGVDILKITPFRLPFVNEKLATPLKAAGYGGLDEFGLNAFPDLKSYRLGPVIKIDEAISEHFTLMDQAKYFSEYLVGKNRSLFKELIQSEEKGSIIFNLVQNGDSSEHGDSGGPVFAYGKDKLPVVVGVTSIGVKHAFSPRTKPFIFTGYRSSSYFRDWIIESKKKLQARSIKAD